MECSQCRTENPSRFRFCGACGQQLPETLCGACGFSTPLPFLYCGQCGTSLDLVGGSQGEERKLATILFADVVGFTTLAENNDPEVMARSVDAAFRQLADIVVAHGGTVDKYIGDSVMAVFGVPQAHDDDAERAVAAALSIQQADTGLGFSIGVNSGDVMVMALGGGALTVMGDAVNVAARLEKAANVNEVLVGPLTVELTQSRVVYKDRPPMTLKGKREPVEVHVAVGLRSSPLSSMADAVPLVGRDDELDFLLSQWRRVRTIRRGGVVLLTGDAGSGKSRLLDELAARVAPDAFVVRSVYPPYGGSGGLRVGGDLVAQLGPSGDPAVQARVRSLAGDVDPSLRAIDPRALRQEQLWALRRLTEDRISQQPVLVLIEDVHMASSSIELLTSFVSRVTDLPVLVVFSGRPEGRWLASFPTASTLRLAPLSASDAVLLVKHLQPELATTEDVVRMSGGNPLFLRELAALATDAQRANRSSHQLPVSLRAVLAARLDSLSATERVALQDLAVIGDTATVEQLLALGGPPASDGIAMLTNSGVVRHRPDGTLRITEPLLREVAYESLPMTVRVDRHVRVSGLAVLPGERARHLERASQNAPDDAELRARAAHALADAGVQALDDSRPTDGGPLLQRAIAMGERDPATLLRHAEALIDRDRGEALTVLGLVPVDGGDPALDAERSLIMANALVDRDPKGALGAFDDAIRKWHALGNTVKEGWSHSNKGVALFMQNQARLADTELATALRLFQGAGNRTGEMATVSFRALVRPDHADVEQWLHESLTYAIELGDRGRHLAAINSLAWHHYLRSRLGGDAATEEARGWIDECIVLATELGANEMVFQQRLLRANLSRLAGRFDEAKEELAQVRRLSAVESRGEQALLRAVSASLVPGSAFEAFNVTDPFTAIAAVVQMETALLEGRFGEIANRGFRPDELAVERHGPIVGYVPAAAGLAGLGRVEEAEALLRKAARAAQQSDASTARAAANAVLSRCASLRGRTESARKLISGVVLEGGLGGALLLQARVALGDVDALSELRAEVLRLDAPGLLQGIGDSG